MKSKRAPYRSPLREQQAADTRERILAALAELIRRNGYEQVSFKALAQQAGVTEITVYRHFHDRTELLRAFWTWMDARLGRRGMPQSEQALLDDVSVVFRGFDEQEALMRAALLSPEGRAMRMSVQPERRAGFERALADALDGLPKPERLRALAVVQLLYSGYAWLSMKDHWGLDGNEAAAASEWAIRALIRDLRSRGQSKAKSKETKS